MHKNARGIYHGTAAGQDDYVIFQHGHATGRERYYVDSVRRGGSHVTIGGVHGFPSIADAHEAIRKDAHTRGIRVGVIFDPGQSLERNGSEESLSFDLQDYGAQMNQWNAGQGDPIYAVGSYAYSGKVHPDREMIESALSELERLEHRERSRSNKEELQILIDQTNEILSLEQTPNARREEPDVQAARELSLYIENEYDLVGAPNSQGKAIEKNLLKKIKAGTFDLALSEKAWMYLMETGAKKYAKEYASPGDWSKMFNKPTRELVAHEFATTFYEEYKNGNR